MEAARITRTAGVRVRRRVNETLAETMLGCTVAQSPRRINFLCECGDVSCHGTVPLTKAELYMLPPGAVRAH